MGSPAYHFPYPYLLPCTVPVTAHCTLLKTPPPVDLFCLDNIFNFFLSPVLTVSWWIYWNAYLFCLYTVLCLFKSRERFVFLRTREARRIAVESVWPVSYVVSRVTVFLTAQYFKARFVWKCLHSTCTAVGLAVVAFIRLSVYSFGALICCSTLSPHLISAL